jgi:hypothetical protein
VALGLQHVDRTSEAPIQRDEEGQNNLAPLVKKMHLMEGT